MLGEPELVQGDLDGFAPGASIREKLSPLPGNGGVEDVCNPVDREKPHEKEVPGHSLSQAVINLKDLVKRIWKEMKERLAAPVNFVNIVRPVDQNPAPDHERQKREADPMKPANGARMLFDDPVHAKIILRNRRVTSPNHFITQAVKFRDTEGSQINPRVF